MEDNCLFSCQENLWSHQLFSSDITRCTRIPTWSWLTRCTFLYYKFHSSNYQLFLVSATGCWLFRSARKEQFFHYTIFHTYISDAIQIYDFDKQILETLSKRQPQIRVQENLFRIRRHMCSYVFVKSTRSVYVAEPKGYVVFLMHFFFHMLLLS